MRSHKVIMGNETSPLEFTCQVDISNPKRHPAIALVIPVLNTFEDIRGPTSNDHLYQYIYYNESDTDSNDPMIYSFQIYPKITMNGTMIRCGVGFSGEDFGPCWGEQVLIVHYVNSSIPTCTPMPSVGESEEILSTEERNGVIAAGAVSGVVIIGAAIALFLGVWKCNGSHSHGKISPLKTKET